MNACYNKVDYSEYLPTDIVQRKTRYYLPKAHLRLFLFISKLSLDLRLDSNNMRMRDSHKLGYLFTK